MTSSVVTLVLSQMLPIQLGAQHFLRPTPRGFDDPTEERLTISFVGGELEEKSNHPLSSSSTDGVFGKYPELARSRGVDPDAWGKTISLVLRRAQEWGHGGAVWICPETPQSVDLKFPLKQPVNKLMDAMFHLSEAEALNREAENEFALSSLKKESMTLEEERNCALRLLVQSPGDNRLKWEDGVSAVARLTQVDGAVLLNQYLDIQGFGAVAQLENLTDIRIAKNHDASETEKMDLTSVGTRHRAALSFCKNNPGGVAFTVSQDGAVSLARTISGKVVIWKPIALDSPFSF
jgi:hypothetical protein